MINKALSICFLFLLGSKATYSQEKDSILSIIANDYGQEKIYIHFDKTVYKGGETIWFKAYLKEGNLPSNISKNFYADWYNDSGKLIQHQAFPIIQSSTNGQFVIDSIYKGSSLHLKAYTSWMLNFDSNFLYKKSIDIFQSKNSLQKSRQINTSLTFFPEGGEIINNISSYVAFKASTQNQDPIYVKGIVKTASGKIVDSFTAEHDGMGQIYLSNPDINETYIAYWQDTITNIQRTTQIPKVVDDGIALQTHFSDKNLLVKISRPLVTSDDKKIIHLFCFMNNNIVYEAKVKLFNKEFQDIEIPYEKFGTGILQVTAFNANYLPLAERVVFINNNNYTSQVSLSIESKNLNKRGKNEIYVESLDSLPSMMSISITDANTSYDSSVNIFTQMLIESDIKGLINNPAYYLQNNETVAQHLDLLMLTHGWRKYDWRKIFNNNLPNIIYKKDTSYINLIGNILTNNDNIQPEQEIIIFAETQDSIKKQLILPVNKKGVFEQPNLIFFDKLKLTYSFLNNKKLNNRAEIVFSNNLYNYPAPQTSIAKLKSILLDYKYYENLKLLSEKNNLYLKNNQLLEEIVLKSRKRRPVDSLDFGYTSGIFSGGNAAQFDVINDVVAQSSFNVFQFLKNRVGGLNIVDIGSEISVTWRGSRTDIYLDQIAVDADVARTVSMNEVAYIKAFRPLFFSGFGGGEGGAIAIYTRKGGDTRPAYSRGLSFDYLKGYTSIKEFYNPNYENFSSAMTDIRETLYWSPNIYTDKTNKKIKIDFFNTDVTKKYRIVLCGMNSEGRMIWVEKVVE